MVMKTNFPVINSWTTQSSLYSHKTWGGVWVVIAIFSIKRELVKHSVVHGCLFTYYLRKELNHGEKTHPSVKTLLMANIAWTILMPQNYIDFHSRTCTRKLQLNPIRT